jgi:hypothetical protein
MHNNNPWRYSPDEPWAGWAAAAGSLSRLHQTVLGWHVVSTSNPTAALPFQNTGKHSHKCVQKPTMRLLSPSEAVSNKWNSHRPISKILVDNANLSRPLPAHGFYIDLYIDNVALGRNVFKLGGVPSKHWFHPQPCFTLLQFTVYFQIDLPEYVNVTQRPPGKGQPACSQIPSMYLCSANIHIWSRHVTLPRKRHSHRVPGVIAFRSVMSRLSVPWQL